MIDITGRLENWRVDPTGRAVIWGDLYEDVHVRWPDGQNVHTSTIPNMHLISEFKEGDIVYTKNSVYKLGKPLEE